MYAKIRSERVLEYLTMICSFFAQYMFEERLKKGKKSGSEYRHYAQVQKIIMGRCINLSGREYKIWHEIAGNSMWWSALKEI